MEKEVMCYIYSFSVDLYNGNKTFYFEFKEDAEIARFLVYKAFDKQRLSVKGFVPPVTKPKRQMVKEKDLDKYKIHPNYDDFEIYYFELTEKMCEESLTK